MERSFVVGEMMLNRANVLLDFVHHNPGESSSKSAFLDPARLSAWGYTAQVLNLPVQAAVTLQSCGSERFPKSLAGKTWVRELGSSIDGKIAAVKAADLSCYAWVDFIVLPRELVCHFESQIVAGKAQQYSSDIKGEFTPDIHQPLMQQLVETQIDEIFTRFPLLDGLVVRVGETYLHDLPYHSGGDPISRGVESHVCMLRLLRRVVCEKHERALFYRTWLSGIDEDPQAYLSVCRKVEPHPYLFFIVKHCTGDFHRTHSFSPPLGLGEHEQIVEVQCQREYEGKGAYPNYIAAGVIDGFEEDRKLKEEGTPVSKDSPRCLRDLANQGAPSGLLTWSRGGGWRGPYITNEFWCAMNAYVLLGWMKEQDRSTDELLSNYFREAGFREQDVERLVRIAHLSTAAVLRGIASTQGGIDTWWTRDHFIGGVEDRNTPMAKAVAQVLSDGRLDEIIAERWQAVELWRDIEQLSECIETESAELRDFIRISCAYGRICFEVFASAWELLLLGMQGDEGGDYFYSRMDEALVRYDTAWREWRELAETHSSCATLYRDTYCRYVRDQGMFPHTGVGDSVKRYRKLLEQRAGTDGRQVPHLHSEQTSKIMGSQARSSRAYNS